MIATQYMLLIFMKNGEKIQVNDLTHPEAVRMQLDIESAINQEHKTISFSRTMREKTFVYNISLAQYNYSIVMPQGSTY